MASKNDGWQTVSEESQLKFDTDGDTFTGILCKMDFNGSIPQAHFAGTGKFGGEDFFTNLGHDLKVKLEKVPVGYEVKITRTGTLDTGHESGTPMTVYEVNYRAV